MLDPIAATQPLPRDWFRATPASTLHTPPLRTCRDEASMAATQPIAFSLVDAIAELRSVRS